MYRRIPTTIVLLIALLCVAGCNQQQIAEIETALAEARQQIDEARLLHQQLQAEIAAMPEGPEREEWLGRAEEVGGWIEEAEQFTERLEAELAQAMDGLGVAQGVLNGVAPFIPPPWNGVAVFAGGLIIGLIRAAQNRAAARRIAASIEAAKQGGTVDFNSPEVKAKVNAAQGASAKRIVDEAQGGTTTLPF